MKKNKRKNRILELRVKRGWTQQELANLIGVRNTAVYYWENQGGISKATALKIQWMLGITEDELFLKEN